MNRQLFCLTLALSVSLSATAGAVQLKPVNPASAQQALKPKYSTAAPKATAAAPAKTKASSPAASGSGKTGPVVAQARPAKLSAAPVKASIKAGSAPRTARHAAGPNYLQAGIGFYNRGWMNKAVPAFEKAAAQDPGSEQAALWLAKSYQRQGTEADRTRAKTAYQKVLAINPNNREALANLGELWSWDPSHRADAIQLLKHAYDLNPADSTNAKKLAEALFWQGNSIDALRYAGPIINKYSTDRKFMSEYAQMLAQTGHTDQALQLYSTVLKTEGERSLQVQVDKARALAQDGQKDQASALYDRINQAVGDSRLSRDPGFGLNMASLAFDLERYDESLRWDGSLPDNLQRNKDVQMRMARALTRLSRTPEAIERFQRLYDAGLLSTDEKLEYAEYLHSLNLAPEALPVPNLIETLYQEAAAEDPQNGNVALRLARYYAESGERFPQMIQAYQTALACPTLSEDRTSVEKEFLDALKSNPEQAKLVEGTFQQMLAQQPNDVYVKTAFAEYLSWQPDRRSEAMRLYVDLAKTDPDNRDQYQAKLEEVLKWHKPTTDLIPLYQELVNLYPQDKVIWLTVARAYRNNKDYSKEAVDTYSLMVKRYPDDATIKREWLAILLSDTANRGRNLELLQKMTDEDPSDLDVMATYGKLLSYEHRYGDATSAFDKVLSRNPEHREALVGKGYVTLWSGRKLEAKDYFEQLRQRYPDDVDVAIGLAQTEKLIGRYDEAMRIIQEIKPLMDQQGRSQPDPQKEGSALNPDAGIQLVANWTTDDGQIDSHPPTHDFSILPYADPNAETPAIQEHPVADAPAVNAQPAVGKVMMAKTAPAGSSDLENLQREMDSLTQAVDSLKALQQSSRRQLDHLEATIKTTRDVKEGETSLDTDPATQTASASPTANYSVGEGGMTPVLGTYAALDYDTNPLLSGLGRFKNDELYDLQKGLTNDLRPMVRAGFLYSRQDGEGTTSRLNSWGFPNQIALSLTPQIRVRGGVVPTNWYIPNGVDPDESWGLAYGAGATIKYWDRLTLDGDFAITHFSQSKTENFTFQTQAQYDFTDAIRAKLGVRRLPLYNSLLSVAGLDPDKGPFKGKDLLGQARENSIYAELNTNPFSQNVDWNLGYEWGWVEGSHIPHNTKNQAFTSLGYTWHYAANHEARLGYEFLYFGYSKNATNGYFNTTARGTDNPVVSLRPVTEAGDGYVFGGYYSPKWFVLNDFRLDLRGSLFNKFLEYKLGGSIGIQNSGFGHGIKDAGGTELASSMDANLIMNLTDWLAAYGDVDFLDAGGQFNRWRFGGGLIIRPHIDGLSPLFGQPSASPASGPASSQGPSGNP